MDRIRKALGNNVVSLMEGIVRNKTLEFLVDNAKVSSRAEGATPRKPRRIIVSRREPANDKPE